jgi:trimeric autotransporter adhesin
LCRENPGLKSETWATHLTFSRASFIFLGGLQAHDPSGRDVNSFARKHWFSPGKTICLTNLSCRSRLAASFFRGFGILIYLLAAFAFPQLAAASEYHGQVSFGGLPLPGATVTVTQGAKSFAAVTDQGGLYTFPDLADGVWKLEIDMQCFSTVHAEVTVSPATAPGKWELTLLPLDQITKLTKLPPAPLPSPSAAPAQKPAAPASANDNVAEIPKPAADASQSADGFLVNGSVNNAATSRFSLDQAFGNRRYNSRSLYTGGLAILYDNSALDARPYSLSGLNTPKAAYDTINAIATLGGPLKIPHLMPRGPTFFVAYQWMRNHSAADESGLVPTAEERAGDLSGTLNPLGQPVVVYNPLTGLPFPGNVVPVSTQARALLQLYPSPNIAGNSLYNYQVPVLDSTHQDALLSRLDKTLGRKDELYGSFNFQSIRASNANLFRFVDATDTLGINTNINWSHRFSQRLFLYSSYSFSRLRTTIVSYFQNRQNISGEAGITGNDQDPSNWGPPGLTFSSSISPLVDANSAFNRNRTDRFSGSGALYRGRHNITIGGDLRKQEYNDFYQQNPRGTFTFTGAYTQGVSNGVSTGGSDLGDFLIGVPDTSSIAYGNADKYFRQTVYDLYGMDDWRIRPNLTINAGLRWEYGAPMTELFGRLVNLDVASGFTAVAPVLGSDPIGPLTGTHYPSSLIRPDRLGIEPRVGISWRPIPASTVVVRAGYGIYDDTSVYQTTVLQLAQQAPLSKSLSVENSHACPLTLAVGFEPCSSITANTFAIDPNFRVGYAQTWQLSIQRDLPGALQFTGTYLGVKGTRGVQQFLPNTYPIGAVNPCPDCPSGFVYQASGGDSTREAGQLQLRRRLRSGFTASLLYTYSKSIDDDAILGGQGHVSSSNQTAAPPSSGQGQNSGQGSGQSGTTSTTTASASTTPSIAQNWLNLHAERSLSTFDQRHLFNLQAQYTSGEGLGGGTLMSGWAGRLFKEWTIVATSVIGTGLPETPIYLAAVPGTGYTGTIRPNPTGAPISGLRAGQHLNPAAYTAPLLGQWGTAGRNSITGPSQFSLDSSLARTFRPSGRFYLDAKVAATNLLNHPVFTGWNTTVNSTQFGVPLAPNAMRSLETSLRLRF